MPARVPAAALGVTLLAAAACVAPTSRETADDVRARVRERLGDVASDETPDVERAVDELLAKPLTADAAVRVALLENRRLRARYTELGVARADVLAAGLMKNPVLDTTVRFPAGGGKPDLDASLVGSFLSILLLPTRVRAATAQLEAAKLRVTGDVVAHAAATRIAYADHQADTQLVAMRAQVVQATSAVFETAKAMHDAGNAPAFDVDRERADHDRARLALADAVAAAAASRERLDVLMGVWGERTAWTLERHFPDIPKETAELADLESRAVAASLDLARARSEIQAEAAGATGVAAILTGDTNAGVAAERDAGEWSVGPTISLPLPFLDQGQGAAAAVEARIAAKLEDYHALAVEVRSAARGAAQAFLTARSRVIFIRDEVLPLHARLALEAQRRHDAMQIGVFELLAEKERELDAGREFVEAQRRYWTTRAELEELFDGRLPRVRAAREEDR